MQTDTSIIVNCWTKHRQEWCCHRGAPMMVSAVSTSSGLGWNDGALAGEGNSRLSTMCTTLPQAGMSGTRMAACVPAYWMAVPVQTSHQPDVEF